MEIWYNWAYSTKILTRNTKNKWSLYYNITSHTIFKITVIQFHTLDNICWIILCVCLVFSYHFPNLNLKLLWSFTAGSIGYGCWWERKWQIMPYVDSSCIIYHFFSFQSTLKITLLIEKLWEIWELPIVSFFIHHFAGPKWASQDTFWK